MAIHSKYSHTMQHRLSFCDKDSLPPQIHHWHLIRHAIILDQCLPGMRTFYILWYRVGGHILIF